MPELDLSPEAFVARAVAASAGRGPVPASGRVTLAVDGSTISLEIRDGRVVGSPGAGADDAEPGEPGEPAEPAVVVPVTAAQLQAMAEGSASMAQAFMRGDLKPEGSTRALLALIELFEDPSFRQGLVGAGA